MEFDGLNIKIVRKKIKNIYFRVNDDNDIIVTCSKYVSESEILKLLKENELAIKRMLKRQKKKEENNNKVLYLGRELQFILFNRIMVDEDKIYAPSIKDANDYLENNCYDLFKSRIDIYMNDFSYLPKFTLKVRKMKTRWGVCNKKSMTVTLNKELIHKKVYLIDYVICHELSHFKYMNHSDLFWNEVGMHYPNYKEARKELRY